MLTSAVLLRSPPPLEKWLAQQTSGTLDYLACFDGDRFAESIRYVPGYPEELPALSEMLLRIATPATIIEGRHDRVVPPANAEVLDERLPDSRLLALDGGHNLFSWQNPPETYASTVLDSIAGTCWPAVGV